MALIGQQSPVRNWSNIFSPAKTLKKIHKVICNTFECIIETQRLYCYFGGFEIFLRERVFLTFDQLAGVIWGGLAFISMRGPSHTRRLKKNLNGVIFFQKLGQVAASYTRGMLKHTPRHQHTRNNLTYKSSFQNFIFSRKVEFTKSCNAKKFQQGSRR